MVTLQWRRTSYAAVCIPSFGLHSLQGVPTCTFRSVDCLKDLCLDIYMATQRAHSHTKSRDAAVRQFDLACRGFHERFPSAVSVPEVGKPQPHTTFGPNNRSLYILKLSERVSDISWFADLQIRKDGGQRHGKIIFEARISPAKSFTKSRSVCFDFIGLSVDIWLDLRAFLALGESIWQPKDTQCKLEWSLRKHNRFHSYWTQVLGTGTPK